MTNFFDFFNLVMIDFQAIIIKWYKNNKRDLPWRNTRNPYKIWVSEIILQQTRVNQGYNYYLNFINEFPDIKALASSSLDKLLKVWQGLGYYSRARNMHITAKYIANNLNGDFPDKFEELIKLKGIGEYTASAIASICYNEPCAVVDGNVYRVLARIFGIKEYINTTKGEKKFKKLANELIARDKPSIYNQAIMEFGATQCLPKNPLCNKCPFLHDCYAYKHNSINFLPAKIKKIIIKNRYFYYLIIMHNDFIYLNKRTKNDIWNSLYEFPLIEMRTKVDDKKIIQSEQFKSKFRNSEIVIHKKSSFYKHILTHQHIYAKYFYIELKDPLHYADLHYIKTSIEDLNKYPFPKLITLIIENFIQLKKSIKL